MLILYVYVSIYTGFIYINKYADILVELCKSIKMKKLVDSKMGGYLILLIYIYKNW